MRITMLRWQLSTITVEPHRLWQQSDRVTNHDHIVILQECIFAQCFISITSFQNEKSYLLQPWNWVLGGGYVWILGTWDIGALNTVFLVIICEILYLNGNIIFHLKVLAYSKHMLHTKLHRSNTASTWETWIRIWTACLFLYANIASCRIPSVM